MKDSFFIKFKTNIDGYSLPNKFTFPFYYDPNPLCLLAAKELQTHISEQNVWKHNFGISKNEKGLIIGKMFGVLVVKNTQNEIGYLCSFSGKLADKNHHQGFVPPVFDLLDENGFFLKGEQEINEINSKIQNLEYSSEYLENLKIFEHEKTRTSILIHQTKLEHKIAKQKRTELRKNNKQILNKFDFEQMEIKLKYESLNQQFLLKSYSEYLEEKLVKTFKKIEILAEQIELLKKERKEKSAILQQKIFKEYTFLNQYGESKNLNELFKNTKDILPPAGAGECAAPKLLQYAFLNHYTPIAMAEFWWGKSPSGDIKKHGNFYPACTGKCEPILKHMLTGIKMEDNPFMQNHGLNSQITILYEDQDLLVINKPPELLSVPGKNVSDSVYSRIKLKYPEAEGPLLAHRLDMSTSGLMLIALNKHSHKSLQRQFIKRQIKKRYVAILNGILKSGETSGEINLPLIVDIDDRPHQIVCFNNGKSALTYWEIIEIKNNKTKVYFYPHTGRTHQLRVHAAHELGLNTPILGDDLYGEKSNRLHLHAESIEFTHPTSKNKMSFLLKEDF